MRVLRLTRELFGSPGIFSDLTKEDGTSLALTLEHAYLQTDGSYAPKIPLGEYTCIRGPHRLHGMDHDFETFEIQDVPAHTGLLFHWGNKNSDSEGCVLVGNTKVGDTIEHSRDAFGRFMVELNGEDSFQLIVC